MIDSPAGYALLLLLAVPVIGLWRLLKRRHESLPLNISDRAAALSWTWRRMTLWAAPALRLLAISTLIIAGARPFDWTDSGLVDSEGIAIELVIDRSGSMREDDFLLAGRRVSRLEAVVDAAGRFVVGNPQLGSRHQDLIGLVTFARQAETACPLTLDHEQVVARLEQLEAAVDYRQDGTAIGEGLALAVAELQSLDRSIHLRDPTAELTRIVVLLTDGQQNAGELTPSAAGRLAEHYGIRTYVIGIQPQSPADDSPASASSRVDGLQAIAEATGGKYFSVSDTRSLQKIYASIDSLERTTLTERRLATRRQWAIEWFRLGPFGLPPIAMIALVALLVETVLQRIVYLKVI